MELNYQIKPGGSLRGTIQIPGDKSISHRAIMLGAIAEGTTCINNFLSGKDCLATLNAFRTMGVNISQAAENQIIINGVGLHGLQTPKKTIDLGNSGTSTRLLTGLLAGQNFNSCLTGDESLCKRPMARVTNPLRQMGAHIKLCDNNFPPISISGTQNLQGIHYEMPIASAQVKSSLLLAGLYTKGETIIEEPEPSRDHTERMLENFGCKIQRINNAIYLQPPIKLNATNINIPSDISSAAFFTVGASIAQGSDILLPKIGINPTRTGVITILQKMGADIQLLNQQIQSGEPIADIRVKSAVLQGIEIPTELVSLAIDEFPIVFIAAACAKGRTILRGAAELRVKESDRIQTMAAGLIRLGIQVEVLADGIVIHGGILQGGEINSYGDHRVAMAFAMAALATSDTIYIQNCVNVATSFPDFVAVARRAGLSIN